MELILKLLAEVDKQAGKIGRTILTVCSVRGRSCTRRTKSLSSFTNAEICWASGEWKTFRNIRNMWPDGHGYATRERIFQNKSKQSLFFKKLSGSESQMVFGFEAFKELSMECLHDYREAIATGSTLIRIGSKIFEKGIIDY